LFIVLHLRIYKAPHSVATQRGLGVTATRKWENLWRKNGRGCNNYKNEHVGCWQELLAGSTRVRGPVTGYSFSSLCI